jgi:hypothetical protein
VGFWDYATITTQGIIRFCSTLTAASALLGFRSVSELRLRQPPLLVFVIVPLDFTDPVL